MKTFTISADERLDEAARRRSRPARTPFDATTGRCVGDDQPAEEQRQGIEETLSGLRGRLQVGRPLTRAERNAR